MVLIVNHTYVHLYTKHFIYRLNLLKISTFYKTNCKSEQNISQDMKYL